VTEACRVPNVGKSIDIANFNWSRYQVRDLGSSKLEGRRLAEGEGGNLDLGRFPIP